MLSEALLRCIVGVIHIQRVFIGLYEIIKGREMVLCLFYWVFIFDGRERKGVYVGGLNVDQVP